MNEQPQKQLTDLPQEPKDLTPEEAEGAQGGLTFVDPEPDLRRLKRGTFLSDPDPDL